MDSHGREDPFRFVGRPSGRRSRAETVRQTVSKMRKILRTKHARKASACPRAAAAVAALTASLREARDDAGATLRAIETAAGRWDGSDPPAPRYLGEIYRRWAAAFADLVADHA